MGGSRDPATGHVKGQKLGGNLNPIGVAQGHATVDRTVPEQRAVLASKIFEPGRAAF